ncbi:hypothetical protein GPECTOR_50g634 [Gonium pectorale]|uniref:SBP-type domain-containing protein n=1 Tax=Gonium pectorale TaxID=33097 RepID=A0A150G906_GONPE|nr:hypothetical protein GPECTOR_50g634 [Gonium pectorale]|eukprot:KXZ45840.1 hypothetical protein GPECTOR_50g634 [Gonium pectorale]
MRMEKAYYRRYNVCATHLRALELLVDGRMQRFCQQCGKFQDVADFDDIKRSCREQLARHSLRRRIKLSQRRRQEMGGIADGDDSNSDMDDAAGAVRPAATKSSAAEPALARQARQEVRKAVTAPILDLEGGLAGVPLVGEPMESAGPVLQRLSLKLYGCSPEELMPDTRNRLQAWLGSMNLAMFDLAVRRGCAHLVADVLTAAAPSRVHLPSHAGHQALGFAHPYTGSTERSGFHCTVSALSQRDEAFESPEEGGSNSSGGSSSVMHDLPTGAGEVVSPLGSDDEASAMAWLLGGTRACTANAGRFPLSALLQQLLGPRLGRPSTEYTEPAGGRLVMQLDSKVQRPVWLQGAPPWRASPL